MYRRAGSAKSAWASSKEMPCFSRLAALAYTILIISVTVLSLFFQIGNQVKILEMFVRGIKLRIAFSRSCVN